MAGIFISLTTQDAPLADALRDAGAVYGAAVSTGDGTSQKVRPLIYQLPESQLPSPFRGYTSTIAIARSTTAGL